MYVYLPLRVTSRRNPFVAVCQIGMSFIGGRLSRRFVGELSVGSVFLSRVNARPASWTGSFMGTLSSRVTAGAVYAGVFFALAASVIGATGIAPRHRSRRRRSHRRKDPPRHRRHQPARRRPARQRQRQRPHRRLPRRHSSRGTRPTNPATAGSHAHGHKRCAPLTSGLGYLRARRLPEGRVAWLRSLRNPPRQLLGAWKEARRGCVDEIVASGSAPRRASAR